MKNLIILGAIGAIAGCSADSTVTTSAVSADKAFDACELVIGALSPYPTEIVERSLAGASTRYLLKFTDASGKDGFPEITCHFEQGRHLSERDPIFRMSSVTINDGRPWTASMNDLDREQVKRDKPSMSTLLEESALAMIRQAETALRGEG